MAPSLMCQTRRPRLCPLLAVVHNGRGPSAPIGRVAVPPDLGNRTV